MKHSGASIAFIHHRNAELMRAFDHQLRLSPGAPVIEIFTRVALSPASRFWVSEERAAVVIGAMAAGRLLPPMSPNKREMYDEIYSRFIRLRPRYPGWSLRRLVALIVCQPAPKFYLTPRSVGEFIYRIRTGYYRRK